MLLVKSKILTPLTQNILSAFLSFGDRKYRIPRRWSNQELRKFSHLFHGAVVNVSGWKDVDKEGGHYREYFSNASSYTITNYKSEARGYQGQPGELFLDLEQALPKDLIDKFDVVFNHTTLEHIYEVHKAFRNLCRMTRDIVILIVPFLQQMHGDYGDYWRFSPLTVKRLFEDNQMEVLYSSFNEDPKTSVYLFFIASKEPKQWRPIIQKKFTCRATRKAFYDDFEDYVGCRSIINSMLYRLARRILSLVGGKGAKKQR